MLQSDKIFQFVGILHCSIQIDQSDHKEQGLYFLMLEHLQHASDESHQLYLLIVAEHKLRYLCNLLTVDHIQQRVDCVFLHHSLARGYHGRNLLDHGLQVHSLVLLADSSHILLQMAEANEGNELELQPLDQTSQNPRVSVQSDRLKKIMTQNRRQSELRTSINLQKLKRKQDINTFMTAKINETFVIRGQKITQEERIKNQGKKFIYPKLIIPAKGRFKFCWDCVTGLLVLYTSFISPLDIAFTFDQGELYTVYKTFDYIVLSFFALDILFNFRTTYYDDNLAEIVDSKLIAKNYLKNYNFYVDVISTVPISELADVTSGTQINSTYTRVFKQLKLFRILRLAKLTKFLQNDNLKTIFQMFKMFFLFIVMFHWLTCLWFYIVKQDYDANDAEVDFHVWIPTNIRELGAPEGSSGSVATYYYMELTNFEKYSYSLYSLVTLILGNDIGPVNTQQVIIGILLSIAGQFLMSLFFGEVSVLIVKLNQESTQYQNGLEAIEAKIKQNNFPEHIKVRIIEYFDYCWQKKISKDNQIDFSFFSRPLETQIHYFLKKEIIKGVPFFQELDSAEILWIIKHLKSEIYLPDDYIIRQGETGDSLYFMTEGIVKVVVRKTQSSDEIVNTFELKKGAFFGEVALLTQTKRTSDVVAIDFCVLESFTRESFQQLQIVFPDIYERLQIGFSHYKVKAIEILVKNLQKNDLFSIFDKMDLDDIVRDYMDLKFVDANKLVLKPKRQSYCLFMLHQGQLAKLRESFNTQYVLRKLLIKKQSIDVTKIHGKKNQKFNHFDYEMEDYPYEDNSNEDCTMLSEGTLFGELPVEDSPQQISDYFVTITGCQILCLSQDKLALMQQSQPHYYNKLLQQFKNIQQQAHTNPNNSQGLIVTRKVRGNEFEQALDQFERMLKSQMFQLQQLNEKQNNS